ncbi:ornithine cyclodeaminase family protein [Brevibacillus composti]|uniref:Ornithine cyclodeaminase family protein n=1 Tax=Brevibacillus composti TaxID=2796470 RepID=A0A7T5JPR9_9BACL|nr:ornithine cyclodeaminase family protein [Brevibacillus composti]QQE75390.1 ornithine cyclodeaminase family protein [Brevibacillus composti]QUO42416.1 ornithine cyclodeaminase family protein [Brevibacillus composti]
MLPFRVINQKTIEQILDMARVIEKVEQAYTLKAQKEATLFPMVFHEFEPGKADMDIKSGHLTGANIFGLKVVSWFGENTEKNLPQLIGTVMVLDSRTGAPRGILSGEHITCMRTGAAGGIGAKYLARPESEHLLLVGTGHQAPFQILATLTTMENVKKVSVYNARSYERAQAFCEKIQEKLLQMVADQYSGQDELRETYTKRCQIEFVPVENIEQTTKEADIIITATSARQPLIKREWVQPGTHITCVGADMEGKQEIDERLFAEARVFVDDVTQSVSVGELETAIKKGIVTPDVIVAEIGEVILGRVPGRQSAEEITIFDSTGIAIQDLLTANLVLDEAEKLGAGTVVEI